VNFSCQSCLLLHSLLFYPYTYNTCTSVYLTSCRDYNTKCSPADIFTWMVITACSKQRYFCCWLYRRHVAWILRAASVRLLWKNRLWHTAQTTQDIISHNQWHRLKMSHEASTGVESKDDEHTVTDCRHQVKEWGQSSPTGSRHSPALVEDGFWHNSRLLFSSAQSADI